MIPANELRIGNWLRDTEVGFKDYFKVTAGDIVTITTGRGSEFAPIPLTPEILLACGFKKYGATDDLQLEYSSDYWITFDRVKMECRLCYDVEYYIEAPHLHIKFLHQLQNIYFALTGTELEYKPK